MVRFHAPIEKPGDEPNAWWIVRIPAYVDAELGKVRRIRGTLNGEAFTGALMPMGGGVRCVNARKDVCKRAGVTIGDVVAVALEADPDADIVAIPAELAAALAGEPALKRTFDAFSPAHRREFAQWIAGAKRADTRVARSERALAMIAERKRPSGD